MARSAWLSGVLLLIACSAHVISPEEARRRVSAGARLVDVRSVEEFEAGHLEGAINIPVGQLERRLSELEPKDGPVVVYCASGFRSARAARLLAAAGFSQVGDLGGMRRWSD
jgi:phage shock protein E